MSHLSPTPSPDRPLLQETETQVLPLGHVGTQAHFADTPDLTLVKCCAADLPATPHPGWEEH